VKKVQALGPVLSEVLRCDLLGWQHPWRGEFPVERPNKEQRAEFYQWLLGLEPRARLICYGCDLHFKRLAKRFRPIPLPESTKKRRYPHWLEPYFFGSAEREMRETMRKNPITGQVDPMDPVDVPISETMEWRLSRRSNNGVPSLARDQLLGFGVRSWFRLPFAHGQLAHCPRPNKDSVRIRNSPF
jgi:hypothetical protein